MSNLISGFKACGIYPLNRNQILKCLLDHNDNSEVNEFSFNASVLNVLRENCGVGMEKKKIQKKRGRQIKPGARVTAEMLENVDPEPQHQQQHPQQPQPGPSTSTPSIRDDDGELWICKECDMEWDDNSADRWIVCNLCGEKFHLQCSGLKYLKPQYWTLNLNKVDFECSECFESLLDE